MGPGDRGALLGPVRVWRVWLNGYLQHEGGDPHEGIFDQAAAREARAVIFIRSTSNVFTAGIDTAVQESPTYSGRTYGGVGDGRLERRWSNAKNR